MTKPTQTSKTDPAPRPEKTKTDGAKVGANQPQPDAQEIGGPKGPEPTRFGDWEQKGRCSDF